SVFNMCRMVLPVMRKERSGHIFNIASIAGPVGMPGASVYSASKFAVAGFSECFAQEVAGFGIKVTSVAPGAFRTDFLDDSSAHFGSVPLPEYKTFSDKICSSSANNNHKQPGAPEKLGQALVELGSVRKVQTGRIGAMTGWRPAWQSVTNSRMQLGS